MKTSNKINYKDYKTTIKIAPKLQEFLIKNAIACLSSRFDSPQFFYEKIVFQKPKLKQHKNFEMLYLTKFNQDKPYPQAEDLAKQFNFNTKDVALDGSVKLLDLEQDIFVRWILLKK